MHDPAYHFQHFKYSRASSDEGNGALASLRAPLIVEECALKLIEGFLLEEYMHVA